MEFAAHGLTNKNPRRSEIRKKILGPSTQDESVTKGKNKMRNRTSLILLTVSVVFFATEMYGQAIERLSAQFLRFDVTESSCFAGSTACPAPAAGGGGGHLVYSHAVFVPALSASPVLYVDFDSQADQHGGVAAVLICNLDGTLPCNAGTGGRPGRPPAWGGA